jgi:hypothetical protein
MPKKQKESQIETKAQTPYPFEIYQDICCEVFDIIKAIESEIGLLEQHCEELMSYFYENDVPDLIELRNRLEETRNHLSRQNYSLGYGSKLHRTLYGDDEFK